MISRHTIKGTLVSYQGKDEVHRLPDGTFGVTSGDVLGNGWIYVKFPKMPENNLCECMLHDEKMIKGQMILTATKVYNIMKVGIKEK